MSQREISSKEEPMAKTQTGTEDWIREPGSVRDLLIVETSWSRRIPAELARDFPLASKVRQQVYTQNTKQKYRYFQEIAA